MKRSAQRHPIAAVDVVIFRVHGDALEALLVKIKHGPCRGRWAFPGGLVQAGESLDQAARRELIEKTPLRSLLWLFEPSEMIASQNLRSTLDYIVKFLLHDFCFSLKFLVFCS